MEDMARYCDDVVVMYGARILRKGSREEVFAHVDELAGTGLDIPQITSLIYLLRKQRIDLSNNVYTVEEAVDAFRPYLSQNGQGGDPA
jgi:ABC-type dipeptide/oligopeptide/nickel transport system ATPase component